MNRVCKSYLDKFVIVFIDDILIYSKSKDHEVYLKLVLELLKKERLFAKFSKCDFWLQEVYLIRHVVNRNGIHVDPKEAFQTLNDNLCNAPILSLPDGAKDFVVYCDVSNQGLGCVLMQRGKVIAEDEVADALSRKEIVKLKRVQAMSMTIQSGIKEKLLAAQNEATRKRTRQQKCCVAWINKRKRRKMKYDVMTWLKSKAGQQRPSGLLQTARDPERKKDKQPTISVVISERTQKQLENSQKRQDDNS
ncbi:putative reverse transcriptase domain-containing protein [Tanacetum coccineum]